jgi:hypothetical protein
MAHPLAKPKHRTIVQVPKLRLQSAEDYHQHGRELHNTSSPRASQTDSIFRKFERSGFPRDSRAPIPDGGASHRGASDAMSSWLRYLLVFHP